MTKTTEKTSLPPLSPSIYSELRSRYLYIIRITSARHARTPSAPLPPSAPPTSTRGRYVRVPPLWRERRERRERRDKRERRERRERRDKRERRERRVISSIDIFWT